MDLFVGFGFLFLGLAVGSFINAFVFRLEVGESAMRGRSHCMRCRRTLSWIELIPVFSFFALRGKCRTCRAPISFQYPVVELLTAAVFFFAHLRYPVSLYPGSFFSHFPFDFMFAGYIGGMLYALITAALLLVIAVYDYRTMTIAVKPLGVFAGLSVLVLVLDGIFSSSSHIFFTTLGAAAGAFLFFFSFWFFSKGRAMGFGDAELAAAVFLFLGPVRGAVALIVSFWSGALFGILLLSLHAATRRSAIPFGPFLVLGCLIAWLWGDAIVRHYAAFMFGI